MLGAMSEVTMVDAAMVHLHADVAAMAPVSCRPGR